MRASLEHNAHALVWSPDGRRLAFSSDRDGPANILVRDVGATGASDSLVGSAQHADPASWSRNARWIVYAEVSPMTSWDIWKYDTSTRQASVLLRTDAMERNPALSPDGRWLAYASNASGRSEIYVEAFPDGGRRIPVSGEGGAEPVWSADGRELFFRSKTSLMHVSVSGATSLELTRPTTLFDTLAYLDVNNFGPAGFAVSLDARSFYFLKDSPVPPAPTRIQVVLGWREEFLRTRGQGTGSGSRPALARSVRLQAHGIHPGRVDRC